MSKAQESYLGLPVNTRLLCTEEVNESILKKI